MKKKPISEITYSNYKYYLDHLRDELNSFAMDHNLSLHMLAKLSSVSRHTMNSFLVKKKPIAFRTVSMILSLLRSDKEDNGIS